VGRYLELSTGHLRAETRDHLDLYEGIAADPTECGWLMQMPSPGDAREQAERGAWPEELLAIVELAWKHDCGRVLFDRDMWLCRELPYFDDEQVW
jgi:hypothetical protein